MPPSRRQRLAVSITCIALGAFLLLVAGEFVPDLRRQANDAPKLIIALSGLVFVIVAFMAFLGTEAKTTDLLAAILCLLFGVIGAWVAIAGPDQAFSGGLPFLPAEFNVKLARGAFGFGSLICFMIAVWALRRFIVRARKSN